jgi:hypothetical protein
MALVEHEHGETEVVEGEKVEGAAKHFEANNAYVDVPMMKDLSKKETPGANRLHGQYSGANAQRVSAGCEEMLQFR